MKRILAAALLWATAAHATGWDSADPKVQAWFRNATVNSCCGEGDAYEADFYEDVKGGGADVMAVVTDDNTHLCRKSWDEEGKEIDVCKAPIPPGSSRCACRPTSSATRREIRPATA